MKSYSGVLLKGVSTNMPQVYRKTPMHRCNFKKVALQNTFFEEHFSGTASDVFVRKFFIFPVLSNVAPLNC